MNHSVKKHIVLPLLALLSALGVHSQVKVTASLDSASIMMGRVDTLRLIVERDADRQGVFPLFHKAVPGGYTTLAGDTIELGFPRLDTLKQEGKRITERLVVPVQVFDSGTYRLPPFVYITASDSVSSASLEFCVRPVQVGENDAIADFKDISDPSDRSFLDWMPDWLYELWWLWILAILGIAAGIYFGMKYRKTGKFMTLPEKPQPKPWTAALDRLEKLKAKKLWENGMEKEYFTELTDILREYLYKRFGINAMEMTTNQIMSKLADQKDVREKRDYVRKILAIADFVKFAKVRPLPADNVAAFDNAVNFVKETAIIEAPASEDAKEDDAKSGSGVKLSDKKGGKG